MSFVIVGVGPGLGQAIARRFAQEGLPVGLVARNAERLATLAEGLERSGAAVGTAVADASDPASLRQALEQLAESLGPVEVLVYNAARMSRGLPSELTPAELQQHLAVDVVGALAAAQAVVPGMAAAGRGTLLFTGGGYAERPWAGMTGLGVGKAALRNLARCMAQEYGDKGIHVATVTIHGMVRAGTAFAPADIAEVYAALHREQAGQWRTEVDFQG